MLDIYDSSNCMLPALATAPDPSSRAEGDGVRERRPDGDLVGFVQQLPRADCGASSFSGTSGGAEGGCNGRPLDGNFFSVVQQLRKADRALSATFGCYVGLMARDPARLSEDVRGRPLTSGHCGDAKEVFFVRV